MAWSSVGMAKVYREISREQDAPLLALPLGTMSMVLVVVKIKEFTVNFSGFGSSDRIKPLSAWHGRCDYLFSRREINVLKLYNWELVLCLKL